MASASSEEQNALSSRFWIEGFQEFLVMANPASIANTNSGAHELKTFNSCFTNQKPSIPVHEQTFTE
jgi:hypothetical protein